MSEILIDKTVKWTGKNCRELTEFLGLETECGPKCKASPIYLIYMDNDPFMMIPGDFITQFIDGTYLVSSPSRQMEKLGTNIT